MQDRRGNVIGKIAVDADAAAGSESGKVGLKNVAGYNIELGEFRGDPAKAAGERLVQFYGANGAIR